MSEHDNYGCPAATDFRIDSGHIMLTRCKREAGHDGRHHSRVRSWHDDQTTWVVAPPGVPTASEVLAEVADCFDPGELDCGRFGLPCTHVNDKGSWCRACRIRTVLAALTTETDPNGASE